MGHVLKIITGNTRYNVTEKLTFLCGVQKSSLLETMSTVQFYESFLVYWWSSLIYCIKKNGAFKRSIEHKKKENGNRFWALKGEEKQWKKDKYLFKLEGNWKKGEL